MAAPLGTVADPFAEPVDRASAGWVVRLGLAAVGMFAGLFGPLQVLLALQATALTPDHKEATLGLVTGVGAAVATLGNPLVGALSDRTRSRFGRRVPWVAGGGLVGAAGLVVLQLAASVPVMIAGWCLVQAGLNAVLAALVASIPDRVPVEQRGLVSGAFGVAQTLGVVAGTGVALLAGGLRAGFVAIAVLLLITLLPHLLTANDPQLPAGSRPPLQWRSFLASFWISPRAHPDFAWAWLTRFLANLANGLGLLYLLFYLQDTVGHANPEGGVFVLTLTYAASLIVTAMVSGIWSDRIGRRKVFVVWSGCLMGVAAGLLAVLQTWPGAILGAALFGVGFGIYLAVDFALITQVLPHAIDRAKDLGVINIAAALPGVLAPAIAGPLVAAITASAGHDAAYGVLYGLTAAVALLSGVLIRFVRGVD